MIVDKNINGEANRAWFILVMSGWWACSDIKYWSTELTRMKLMNNGKRRILWTTASPRRRANGQIAELPTHHVTACSPVRLSIAAPNAAGLKMCLPCQVIRNFDALEAVPAITSATPPIIVLAGCRISNNIKAVMSEDSILVGIFRSFPSPRSVI